MTLCITVSRWAAFLLLAGTSSTVAMAQKSSPSPLPKEEDVVWTPVPSLKELVTMPASATHLILEGMGDDAAEALRARPNVRGVLFRDDRGTFTDAGMTLLTKLPDLRALQLDGTKAVTIEGMKRIGEMRSLTEVGLKSVPCEAATLNAILGVPSLVGLELNAVTGLDDHGITAIAGCKRLRRLQFAGVPSVGADSIVRLAALVDLEELDLSGLDALTDDVFANFRGLQKLRWVCLYSDRLTSEGLRTLAGMRGLRRLNLSGDKFGSGGLLHLPVTLEALHLADCPGFDEATGTTLRDRFPSLQHLDIDRAAWLTDTVVRSVLQAPKLAMLDLHLCQEVTARGFDDIAKASSLQRVSFEMCDRITEADGEAMQKARSGLKVIVVD